MRSLSLLLFLAACKGEAPPTETGTSCIVGFADRDGDGFGNPRMRTSSCQEPVVENGDDCNDLFLTAYPGATEICDGADNDCDGLIDAEDPELDLPAQYLDSDGDGFGTGNPQLACEPLPDHVLQNGDCDDTSAQIHPGMLEICDDVDNNCDGEIDDDDFDDFDFENAPLWFIDSDGDGYAGPVTVAACEQPEGGALAQVDCDDTDPASFPNATERCNNKDDDCDGVGDLHGPCDGYDGLFTGSFTVAMSGPSDHVCTGTAEITVSQVGTPPVQGSYTCAFDTEAGWMLEQHGVIEGYHDVEGVLDGTFVTLDGQTYPWSGDVDLQLSGSGGGLFILGNRTFDVEAEFTLELP